MGSRRREHGEPPDLFERVWARAEAGKTTKHDFRDHAAGGKKVGSINTEQDFLVS